MPFGLQLMKFLFQKKKYIALDHMVKIMLMNRRVTPLFYAKVIFA